MKTGVSSASLAMLVIALLAVLGTNRSLPTTPDTRRALSPPPSVHLMHAATLAEPQLAAQILALHVQGYDATPKIAGTLKHLDYQALFQWLEAIALVDPESSYSVQLALLYSRVDDTNRKRQMLALVAENFTRSPQERWRAMAEAAVIARHELQDLRLALYYAELLERYASGPDVPGWVQQMHALLLADIGEQERARIVLGALLASGKVHNAHELRLLESRLLQARQATP